MAGVYPDGIEDYDEAWKVRTGTFFGNSVPRNEILMDKLFRTETKHLISYAKKG